MILTIASFKGGVGKTTSAVHLAVYLQEIAPTVLIDGDPNRSARGWAQRGGLPYPVVDERQSARVARQFPHIVIDTQARPSREDLQALVDGCDLLILPTTADALSLDALMLTVETLRGLNAERFRILLTMLPPRPSRDGEEARAMLTDAGLPLFAGGIRRAVAFQKAALAGVGVCEVSDPRARDAWSDYVAIIVPDGVLFGSSTAHKALRQNLVENQKLDAVISMPSGVFKPYAGVSTAILFFTKTNSGGTDKVWFYNMEADGFSLDDKRTERDSTKHENNNLPDILARWKNRAGEEGRARSEQSFLVPKADIAAKNYDLSLNRYREVVQETVSYDPPEQIIDELAALECEIQQGLERLRAMLKGKEMTASRFVQQPAAQITRGQ